MTVTTRLVCLALALVVAPLSWSKGSIEDGATKSAVCTACHGPMGNSTNPQWPSLAGQNAAYIVGQLKLFHASERVGKAGDANPLTMMPMAQTLSDQDMEDVAAYFAAQVPTGAEADPSYWKAGQIIYTRGDRAHGIPACSACHGPVGAGNPDAGYPALRGQSSVYVLRQLGNYAADARYTKNEKGASNGGDNAAIMHTVASRLSDEDMRNLASYIQGLR
jgi:cytochrome c553